GGNGTRRPSAYGDGAAARSGRMKGLPVIGALGAGRMGRGIAQVFAYAGHDGHLIDAKPRSPAARSKLELEALAEIDSTLAMLSGLGAFDDAQRPQIMRRIHFAGRGEAYAALKACDVVFEGVPEVLDAKRGALAFACEHMREDAILASTTSTILVTQLAGLVTYAERFLNAHWLNPAYIVP